MDKFLYNPTKAEIKNWFDGVNRWSLGPDEVKAFPEEVAHKLVSVYQFLVMLTEAEVDARLAALEAEKVVDVKVEGDKIVPKSEDEVKADKEKLETKKKVAKTLKTKVSKASKAEPDKVDYHSLSRGDLIALAHSRGVEIKGLGNVSITKEQVIQLLENDDNK